MYEIPNLQSSDSKPSAIAVLTSGGDSPGMNPAIRGVVRAALHQGIKVYGVNKGYSGLIIGDMAEMDSASVTNIVQRGGTLLKSDRCLAFKDPAVRHQAAEVLKEKGIEGLVVIGGDGSLTGAHLLTQENDIKVIGLPGTIDNDIYGTDFSIGFDTAVNTAVESIDKIRDTATSHDPLFIVEVMGRNSGFIALNVGIAGGAQDIFIPEKITNVDEVINRVHNSFKRGKLNSILVTVEGQKAGRAYDLAEQIRKKSKLDAKVCILGHVQRGGSPSARDRILASAFGAGAVDGLQKGMTDYSVGLTNSSLSYCPLSDCTKNKKEIRDDLLLLTQELAN